jgi:tetratricopeptide (TPR) repeat protein
MLLISTSNNRLLRIAMRLITPLLLASLAFSAPAAGQSAAPEEEDPCRAGVRAMTEGEPEAALSGLEACLAAGDLTPEREMSVLARLGAIHLAAERYEDALSAYDLVFAIADTREMRITSPAIRRNRGIARAETGRTEGALEDLSYAVSMDPRDSLARMNYGALLQDEGRAAEAVVQFDAVVRLEPDWGGAWISRSFAFLDLGDYDSAVDDARRAVEIDPEDGFALNALCWNLVQADRAGLALPICEQAVEAAPESGPVVHSRAAALEALGRDREARRGYARAFDLAPDDPEIRADYERTRRS